MICFGCFKPVDADAAVHPGGWVFHPGCDLAVQVTPPSQGGCAPDPRLLRSALDALTPAAVRQLAGRGWSLSDCRAVSDYFREINQRYAWLRLQILMLARELESGQQEKLTTRLRNVAAEVTR